MSQQHNFSDLKTIYDSFENYCDSHEDITFAVQRIVYVLEAETEYDWEEIDYIASIINTLLDREEYDHITTITNAISCQRFYLAYSNSELGMSCIYNMDRENLCADLVRTMKTYVNADRYNVWKLRNGIKVV